MQRNVDQNKFLDTEPTKYHNQIIFGKVLRGSDQQEKKNISYPHMHLKSYDDMERLFDNKQMYEQTKILRKK